MGLYLTWNGDRLHLTPELRTAKAPASFEIRLVTDDPAATHLEIRRERDTSPVPPPPPATLAQRILRELERHKPVALRRVTLRDELKVNNAKLGETLTELEKIGLVARSGDGWILGRSGVPFHATPGSARNGTRNDTPGETDPSAAGVQLGKG